MRLKIKNQSGTALIVTILLVGLISAIAFGMTKIALNEYFVGGKNEESLQAYYAAQAGVEDALMRFKFYDKSNLEVPAGATKQPGNVLRVYVNKGGIGQPVAQSKVSFPGETTTPTELNAENYVYDLKVWYKEKCPTDGCIFDLGKDKSVLLDVSQAQNPFVSWQVGTKVGDTFTPSPTPITDAKLWYRLSDPITPGSNIDPTGQYRDFFTYLAYYDENQNPARSDSRFTNISLPRQGITLNTRGAQVLKFKAFLTQEGQVIRITVKPQSGDVLGGPTTHIESTGYFGNTAKKIEVSVDRESKSILNIFDYVLYSGGMNGNLP